MQNINGTGKARAGRAHITSVKMYALKETRETPSEPSLFGIHSLGLFFSEARCYKRTILRMKQHRTKTLETRRRKQIEEDGVHDFFEIEIGSIFAPRGRAGCDCKR